MLTQNEINFLSNTRHEIAIIGEDYGFKAKKFDTVLNKCGLTREDTFLLRNRPNIEEYLYLLPNLKLVISMGEKSLKNLGKVNNIKNNRGNLLNTEILDKKFRSIYTLCPSIFRTVPATDYITYLDIKKALSFKNKPKLSSDRTMCVYPTYDDWRFFIERTKGKKYICADIETMGKQITRLGLCVDNTYAISVPFKNINTQEVYNNNWIWPDVYKLFTEMIIIGQNFINYDMPWLEYFANCVFPNPIYDTMIAQHIILPGLPKLLTPLSLQFLGSIYTTQPFYKDEGKTYKKIIPKDKIYGEYNCKDVFTTFESAMCQMLHPNFKSRLDMFKFETELAQTVLHHLSKNGVLMDVKTRESASIRAIKECEYFQLKVCEKIEKTINISSPPQVMKLLYDQLKLKPIYRKNDKGEKVRTSNEDALKTLKANYHTYDLPELEYILKYRHVEQLRKGILSTEIDPDNKIRSTFKQDEDTGRLSGGPSPFWTGQSLQVIPRDKKIRKLFITEFDVWVHRDLSQAEAWVVYYLANATDMLDKMKKGLKPHQLMAALISGKSYELCGKGTKEYDLGKKIVHAANYLIGPVTLAASVKKELGIFINKPQAKQYINSYYNLVPEVPKYHRAILSELLDNSMTLVTPLSRKRKFFGHCDGTVGGSIALLHKAVAYKPQSTIGDLLNHILLKWDKNHTVGKLIVPVHDEGNWGCNWKDIKIHLSELDDAFSYPFDIGEYKDIIIPWDTSLQKNWGEKYTQEEINKHMCN